MARRVAVLIAASVFGLAQAGIALAGGWAITVIDDAPTEFEANAAFEVRYTILQHGKTPVSAADLGSTSITFTPADGGPIRTFNGEPTDVRGQYLAEVALPTSGAWSWEVHQGWFGVQELGTITVQQAQGSSQLTAVDRALRVGLPLATLIAVALLTVQVLAYRTVRPDNGVPDSVG